ncbi:MAG: GAF domain-containing protein [Anaerolineales bacterium]|nr:GAF domain-containing protein [Anaerolineales bacterium]
MRLIRRRQNAAPPSDVLENLSILLAECRTSAAKGPIIARSMDLIQDLAPSDSLLLLGYPFGKDAAQVLHSLGSWSSLGGAQIEFFRRPESAGAECRVHGIPVAEVLRRVEVAPHHLREFPLCAGKRAVGALWIGRGREPQEDYSPEEVRICGIIADILGLALSQLGIHNRLERQYAQLASFRTVERAIASSMDLNVTLNVFLDQTMTQLEADAAAILLLDPPGRDLTLAAARGFRKENRPHSRIRLDHALALQAGLERKTASLEFSRPDDPARLAQPLMRDEDFYSWHAAPLIAHGQVRGILEVFRRSPAAPDPDRQELLELLAVQGAIAINSTESLGALQRIRSVLDLTCDSAIEGWSRAVDLHARDAEGHGKRVAELSARTAEHMGIPPDQILAIRRGALLHDIGKIGIPDRILWKPEPLTEEEWSVMRLHPKYAEHLLEPIEFLRPALDIPKYHHERWDGSGYPYGLAGTGIPLAARIFSVIDVWDSMQARRPFRDPRSEAETVVYLRQSAGRQFDPEAVGAFLEVLKENGL